MSARARAAVTPTSARPWLHALATIAVIGTSAAAQPVSSDTTRRERLHTEPLFLRRDLFVAAGFVAATVAFLPLDEQIAVKLREPETQANRFLRHAATNAEYVADPGAVYIGVGMYALGRAFRIERAADLGLHGTEALLVGNALTGVLKGLAGRARPFVHADTNPRDFRFGHGFGDDDRRSFPSGHTTAAFAAAAAVTYETHEWWPRSTWIVAPLLYGGAAMVGASRMYHDRHWASDVALGAGIGTFAGLKVVRFNHRTRAGNRLDRFLLGTSASADTHGSARLAWTAPLPRGTAEP